MDQRRQPGASVRHSVVVLAAAVLVATFGFVGAPVASGASGAEPPPTTSGTPVGTVETFGVGIEELASVATGPDGNIWFAGINSTLGRVTPSGDVRGFFIGDADHNPYRLTAGPDGAVWFTVWGSTDIRRMTTSGAVTSYPTTGFVQPTDIVAGPDGNLWFTDQNDNSIGRITPTGTVTPFTGVDIAEPEFLAVGPDGNLWFTSGTDGIGRITTAGVATRFTGAAITSPSAITAGPDGALWFTNGSNASLGRITTTGTSTIVVGGLGSVRDVVTGPDGNLWVASLGSIQRVTTGGSVTTFDQFAIWPTDLVVGGDGALWYGDRDGDRIGRITTAGANTFLPAVPTRSPYAITTGPDANLWFTAIGSDAVARVTPAGVITAFTDPSIHNPAGITTGPDGALWFANAGGLSIGRITTSGAVTSYPTPVRAPDRIVLGGDGNLWFTSNSHPEIGRLTPGGDADVFTDPSFSSTMTITAGPDGNVWFASHNDIVGRITPNGEVATYPLPGAADIATGPDGLLWIATSGGGGLHRISPSGEQTGFSDASIVNPHALTAGPDGAMWFGDSGGRIGRMTTTGSTTHVDGPPTGAVYDLAAGPDGHVWFAGDENWVGRVRAVEAGAPTSVHAEAGAERATVTWAAPVEPSHSVTGYEVQQTDGVAACTTTGATSCVVTGLAVGVPRPSYTFRVRTTGPGGPGPWSNASNAVTPWSGSTYHAMAPVRILDSRLPDVGFSGQVVAGAPRQLQVTGLAGAAEVPTSAEAVVLNVTVTDSNAESFLTVYPAGSATPNASNINFGAGQVIPNLVTVKVGAGGKVAVATAVGSTNVVADLVGYYDDGNGGGDFFTPVTPVRVLDSRTSTGGWNAKLAAGSPRGLAVRQPQNPDGVPPSASAVIANVTVTGGDHQSFVSLWPSGSDQPNVSNLNLMPGQTIANLAVVKVGAGGSIQVANAVGSVHVIVDVVGYYDHGIGESFHPLEPTRILDTRTGLGLTGPQGPGQTRGLLVAGHPSGLVPFASTGVVANVTVADATAESFVAVFPGNGPRPEPYSTLNFGRQQVIANQVVVGFGQFGAVGYYNHLGSTALVTDVVGYFGPI